MRKGEQFDALIKMFYRALQAGMWADAHTLAEEMTAVAEEIQEKADVALERIAELL